MRILSSIFISFVFSSICIAQIEWAPPGSHWTYYHSNFGGELLVELSNETDTIIDEMSCQVLGELYNSRIITCHENGLVQLYRSGELDTLFHFNADIGDSWIIYDDVDPMYQTVWIKTTVVDKGNYIIGIDTLAMYVAEIEEHSLYNNNFENDPQFYTHIDTIVEKLGMLKEFILPWDRFNSYVDGHLGGPLRCYSDNEISYNRNEAIACDSLTFPILNYSNSYVLGMGRNSEWIYTYNNGWTTTGYHEIRYGNDTIIDDRVANVLDRTQVYFDFRGSPSVDTIKRSPLIVFGTTDLVELLIDNEFDTLYNFGGDIGDSWTNRIENYENMDIDINIKHTIEDKGQIELGPEALLYDYFSVRYEYLNFDGEYVEDYQIDTIVRHIGNISRYILPWHSPPTFVDFADGGPFRCYSNFDELVYQKNPSMACDFIVSNDDLTLSNQITVYPNPTNNALQIDVDDLINEAIFYSIYSINGKLHQQNIALQKNKIDVSSMESGLYFLQLKTSTNVFAIKKFIKQ